MLGLLLVYGVGGAKDQKQGLHWLQLASRQGNEDAQALLADLQTARLRAAESERRKADQASHLRAELERAKASEQALQKRLAQSKQRQKALESERVTLSKARAQLEQDSQRMRRELQQDADRVRRERTALEAELVALRARVAEGEQARKSEPPDATANDVAGESSGEIVVSGTILEILPEGVLLTDVSRRREGQGALVPEAFDVFVNLLATNGLARGQEIAFVAEPTIAYRYKTESGAVGRVKEIP